RRNAFAEAVTYAKVAKGALEYQAAAATSGRSAFAVAVSDFLRRRAVREDGLHTAGGQAAGPMLPFKASASASGMRDPCTPRHVASHRRRLARNRGPRRERRCASPGRRRRETPRASRRFAQAERDGRLHRARGGMEDRWRRYALSATPTRRSSDRLR